MIEESYSGYVKGTRLLLEDGSSINVEDLGRRHVLMSPSEHECRITSTDTTIQPVYKVTPIGGVPFTASIDQLLYVQGTDGTRLSVSIRYLMERAPHVYMERFSLIQGSVGAFTRVGINMVHIPPYIAGLVIGQGYLSASRMKSINKTKEEDSDIATWKSWVASIADLHIVDAYKLNLTTISKDHLTLRCDVANEAFVPEVYKYQPASKRCDLIAGLMDAQGEFNEEQKTYTFKSPSAILLEDMIYLCRSIGLKATPILYSPETNKITGAEISGEVEKIPCRLQGRCESPKNTDSVAPLYRFLITPMGEAEVHRFQVSGTGLYMLDSFIIGSCGQGTEIPRETDDEIGQITHHGDDSSSHIEEEGINQNATA